MLEGEVQFSFIVTLKINLLFLFINALKQTHTRTERGMRMLCFCFDLFVLSMCIRCGWYTTRWAREFLLLYFSHSKIANSCVNSCCEAHVYVQNMYIFMCGWCVIRAHTYFHLPWLLATETISCVFLPIFLSLTHMCSLFFYILSFEIYFEFILDRAHMLSIQ